MTYLKHKLPISKNVHYMLTLLFGYSSVLKVSNVLTYLILFRAEAVQQGHII